MARLASVAYLYGMHLQTTVTSNLWILILVADVRYG